MALRWLPLLSVQKLGRGAAPFARSADDLRRKLLRRARHAAKQPSCLWLHLSSNDPVLTDELLRFVYGNGSVQARVRLLEVVEFVDQQPAAATTAAIDFVALPGNVALTSCGAESARLTGLRAQVLSAQEIHTLSIPLYILHASLDGAETKMRALLGMLENAEGHVRQANFRSRSSTMQLLVLARQQLVTIDIGLAVLESALLALSGCAPADALNSATAFQNRVWLVRESVTTANAVICSLGVELYGRLAIALGGVAQRTAVVLRHMNAIYAIALPLMLFQGAWLFWCWDLTAASLFSRDVAAERSRSRRHQRLADVVLHDRGCQGHCRDMLYSFLSSLRMAVSTVVQYTIGRCWLQPHADLSRPHLLLVTGQRQ